MRCCFALKPILTLDLQICVNKRRPLEHNDKGRLSKYFAGRIILKTLRQFILGRKHSSADFSNPF